MKILAFLNGKGGVGKTTLSINVSTCLARMGYKVCVVDTDPQSSIVNWCDADKCKFDIAQAASEKQIYDLHKHLKDYDYVVIDGAAAISAISAASVMVSDCVLIPLSASPLDFSASGAILSVIEARSRLQPVIARFVPSRKVANAQMNEVLKASIAATGLEMTRTGTSRREIYVKSMIDGGTIYDYTDSAAKGEIDNLTREILELVA